MLNFTEIKERNNNIGAFKKKNWRRSINGTFQLSILSLPVTSHSTLFYVETII